MEGVCWGVLRAARERGGRGRPSWLREPHPQACASTSTVGPGEGEGVAQAPGAKHAAVGRESLNSFLLSTKNSEVLLLWRWLPGWRGWPLAKSGAGAPVWPVCAG